MSVNLTVVSLALFVGSIAGGALWLGAGLHCDVCYTQSHCQLGMRVACNE
jgi:hypothetical protein